MTEAERSDSACRKTAEEQKQRMWIWWKQSPGGESFWPSLIIDDFEYWSGKTVSEHDKIIEYELDPDGTLRPTEKK